MLPNSEHALQAALIAACKQRNIPILCVAGAGEQNQQLWLEHVTVSAAVPEHAPLCCLAVASSDARLANISSQRTLAAPHACKPCTAQQQQATQAACTGAKADPTRLRIGDLSDAGTDPLARTVRRSLRKKHGIVEGVPTLLSVEAPRCQLMSVDALPGSPQDFQVPYARYLARSGGGGWGARDASLCLRTLCPADPRPPMWHLHAIWHGVRMSCRGCRAIKRSYVSALPGFVLPVD